jgi:hypothetical protein
MPKRARAALDSVLENTSYSNGSTTSDVCGSVLSDVTKRRILWTRVYAAASFFSSQFLQAAICPPPAGVCRLNSLQ